jgi:hypothetical protein
MLAVRVRAVADTEDKIVYPCGTSTGCADSALRRRGAGGAAQEVSLRGVSLRSNDHAGEDTRQGGTGWFRSRRSWAGRPGGLSARPQSLGLHRVS